MDKKRSIVIVMTIMAGFYLGRILVRDLSIGVYVGATILFVMYFSMRQAWVYALSLLIFLSLEIIDMEQLPKVWLPVGSLIVSDVFYVVVGLKVLMSMIYDRGRKLRNPITLPLIFVIVSMVIASIVTAINSGQIIDLFFGLRRTLPFMFAIFFIYIVKSAKDLDKAYSGFISVALVASIFITFHYTGGKEILERFPILKVETKPRQWLEYYKYIPSCFGIVAVAFITSIIKDYKTNSVFRTILIIILGVPILISFSMTFWVSIIVSIFFTYSMLNREKVISKSFRTLFIIVFLIIFIPALVQLSGKYSFANLLSGIFTRIGFSEEGFIYSEISIGGRMIEANFAMDLIRKHPILGNGLSPNFWGGESFRDGAHVGLIDLWLQLGLFGLFSSIWFIFVSLKRILYVYKRLDNPYYKSLISVSFSTILSGVLASVLSNQFFYPVWQISVGFFIGLTECVWRFHCEKRLYSKKE